MAIRRDHFPMTTVEEVVADMPQAKLFSVLDATSGYWKVKIDEATIGDKIVETLYLNRVTSENKRIRTPPLSPPFKVGMFVVFYR